MRLETTIPTLLILVACGGSDAQPDAQTMESESPAAAPAQQQAAGPIDVVLTPLPNYIAEGTVTLTRDGDSIVTRVVAETHLNQGDYPMHIHEGTCAEGGRVVVPLTTVEGQESGEGTATTTFPASQLSPTGTYFIWIHSPTGEPVACADLPPLNL
jgi:hypothetical protein